MTGWAGPPVACCRRSRASSPGARKGSAACDGWKHDDMVPVAHGRVEPSGEADVLVVDVDVHEAPQVALTVLGLDEPLLDAGVVALEVLDELGERGSLARHRLLTVGVGAQD